MSTNNGCHRKMTFPKGGRDMTVFFLVFVFVLFCSFVLCSFLCSFVIKEEKESRGEEIREEKERDQRGEGK